MYSIQTILDITHATLLNAALVPSIIEHLIIDSRQVNFPKTSLFFALQGQRQDGHDYIQALYNKGVRNFVVAQKLDTTSFFNANFLYSPTPLFALQALGTQHRKQFPTLPVIAITGSNGKTMVKEWLYQLLSPEYNIVRSPKSFNSQIGVALSVWQIEAHHTLGIFEAGISQKGEMARIEAVLQPTIGVFTNLGNAHDEGFSSKEEKLQEKYLLFKHSKTIIDKQSLLNQSLTFPFSDKASLANARLCAKVMEELGYTETIIQQRILQLQPIPLRQELKAGINGCLVINDSYNSDLTSLSLALHFMEQQATTENRTLILSDILQSGQSDVQLYGQVIELLREHPLSRFIGIGKVIFQLSNFFDEYLEKILEKKIKTEFYWTTEDFLTSFQYKNFQQETILIKGARPFAFERIAERLVLKAHKTVLEINLNALRHNLNIYAQHLQPGVKMMAMVKASAYGSGSAEVAKLLEYQKIDYLSVAYTDEGVMLRKEGIKTPILVLNPDEASLELMRQYDLEPELYNLSLVPKGGAIQLSDLKGIHLKLDTGMHRLGFAPQDIPALIAYLKAHPNIQIKSIFSHLAASEAPEHDAFTALQFERFTTMYEAIAAAIGYRPLRHIANTGGIVRSPQYHLDMVRLGIGLYGIDSSQTVQGQLQVVNTLKATISQIKQLDAGETVGYSRRGIVNTPKRTATISIGYADGLSRGAGNGNYAVLVRGELAPIIGSVCMDMTMLDITSIPSAQEGDEVIIFGTTPSVQTLATALNTIPYEIFTGISERVKRVYFQ